MGKLIYSMIQSVDGYVADASGGFGWATPDEEVHGFINDLQRPVGTYLLGRRMYEVMAAWDTMGQTEDEPAVVRDFADLWAAMDKVVYSSTLTGVATAGARLESAFDHDAVRTLKAKSNRDVAIGGPTIAAEAIEAGLVDEYQLFVVPHVAGGGLPTFVHGIRLDLELAEERRFQNGFIYLNYRARP